MQGFAEGLGALPVCFGECLRDFQIVGVILGNTDRPCDAALAAFRKVISRQGHAACCGRVSPGTSARQGGAGRGHIFYWTSFGCGERPAFKLTQLLQSRALCTINNSEIQPCAVSEGSSACGNGPEQLMQNKSFDPGMIGVLPKRIMILE